MNVNKVRKLFVSHTSELVTVSHLRMIFNVFCRIKTFNPSAFFVFSLVHKRFIFQTKYRPNANFTIIRSTFFEHPVWADKTHEIWVSHLLGRVWRRQPPTFSDGIENVAMPPVIGFAWNSNFSNYKPVVIKSIKAFQFNQLGDNGTCAEYIL